jgi:hypothetical protein
MHLEFHQQSENLEEPEGYEWPGAMPRRVQLPRARADEVRDMKMELMKKRIDLKE